MNENNNKNDLFDLGSEPVEVDFDPFAEDDIADDDSQADTSAPKESDTEVFGEVTAQAPTAPNIPPADLPAKAAEPKSEPKEADKPGQDNTEKPPVFEYAGAMENIDDTSKTFDELRMEKSSDFPELEDGKRVSWTVEYGKITKTVPDPKGTSIGRMKSDIETSKEFADSLKKRGADKNPTCKVKPRVTAQSKGVASAYKGVFCNLEEAETAGKVISIVPAKDGKVYEIRDTEMGKFITPVSGCELLSDVQAGFIPALPRIPAELMMQVIAFFRHFTNQEGKKEALVNIYWDKNTQEFVADAPEQVVTEVSINSQISDELANDRYIHYMDIHSHNTMPAFFSSVDDHDEKATRLYCVIGRLNECVPEIKARISNGGKFLDIDPAEVFELVGAPFPDEWKDKVHSQPKHKKGIKKAISRLSKLKKKMLKGVVKHAVFVG